MLNVHTQMPSVKWSTVPGARSRGFDRDNEEKAEKFFEILCKKADALGIIGLMVLMTGDGKTTSHEVS